MSSLIGIDTDQFGLVTQEMREHNVRVIGEYFLARGWTRNAIAAMCGNMQSEGLLNPGQWEGGKGYSTQWGYGLVQWTPATKYIEWAGSDWRSNYDKQMARIVYEFDNGIQYYPTVNYPESAYEFSRSEKKVSYLTAAWEHNYERPASYDDVSVRIERAEYWYEFLGGVTPIKGDIITLCKRRLMKRRYS